MAPDRPDVLVVGGGIVGLACARELHRSGQRVAVLDGREPGSGASTAAAGLLSPLAEAHPDSDFLRLCLEARDLWLDWAPELEDDTGLALGHVRSGALVPSRDPADEEHLERLAAVAREAGEPCETVACEVARREVPNLSPLVERVLLLPGEHRVDNVQAVAALLSDLERRGVAVHSRRPVQRVEPRSDRVVVVGFGWRTEARVAVIAAGAWSGVIAGLPPLPVRPVRGEMISFDGCPWPWRGSIRARDGYVVRRGPERVLVGATVEDVGFDASLTEAGRARLLALVERLLPGLPEREPSAHWAGLRPATPDDLPILGWHPAAPTVLWATGHFRNGILLAPWTARRVATMIASGERNDPIAALAPSRFRSRIDPV